MRYLMVVPVAAHPLDDDRFAIESAFADHLRTLRQLLAGRDIARTDPVARQMVNFVYAGGDRRTGECVLVDPAYAVKELVDLVGADGMTVTGALAAPGLELIQ